MIENPNLPYYSPNHQLSVDCVESMWNTRMTMPTLGDEVGGRTYNSSVTPLLDATLVGPKLKGPFHGVELQASNLCPKNFIIFDQDDNKSRLIFHPGQANKFCYPSIGIQATDPDVEHAIHRGCNSSSSFNEDSRDIDAFLSLEEDADEDEEVSTGRTMGLCDSSSPDTYSTSSSDPLKRKVASIQKSFPHSTGSSNSNNQKRRHRMRKLLTALRTIVPGGDQMDSATVLDEAVKYLQSLRMEVKNLGIENFKK